MTGHDTQPFLPDGRRSFHTGATRRVELSLKQEIDDLTNKSMAEIAAKNQAKLMQPLTDEQLIARKLYPEFIHKRSREKLKLHPIFHDDLKSKEYLKEDTLVPNIPSYNSLDKNPSRQMLSKTRKYPYVKDKQITTSELQKPHTTSVGVVPNRPSAVIPNLNVVLTGSSADPRYTPRHASLADIKTATAIYTGPCSSPEPTIIESDRDLTEPDMTLPKKPAIVSTLGTTKNIALCDRRAPTSKPSTLSLKKRSRKQMLESDMLGEVMRSPLKSGRSLTSSLLSQEIVLPDDRVYGKYDAVISSINADASDVETAVGQEYGGTLPFSESKSGMKTVQELCEEAQKIASPGAPPIYKQHLKASKTMLQKEKLPASPSIKKTTKSRNRLEAVPKKIPKIEKEDTTLSGSQPRSERSVDEIISSLRDQSRSGTVSEADRRIQEIMSRVMSRSSAVLGDVAGVEEENIDKDSTDETPIPEIKTDKPSDESLVTTEEIAKAESQLFDVKAGTIEAISSVSLLPDVPPPVVEAASSDEEVAVHVEKEMSDEEPLDIQQAWMDLHAAPEATYEDLVSVEGHQKEIQRRMFAESYMGPRGSAQSSSVSFLSTWAHRETMDKAVKHVEKLSKKIHHFCTTTAEFQLPKELQNIGRKYHTPARFPSMFPDQPYRFGSTGPTIPLEMEEGLQDEEHQRASDAAERVLKDLKTTDQDNSLEAWQQRANQVFFESELNIEGNKIALKSDESRVYWDPAPAKLNVMPSRVKDVLFPEYTGMTVVHPEQNKESEIEYDSDSDSESDVLEVSTEDQEAIKRVLARKHTSCSDLTNLVKDTNEKQQLISAGMLDPYSLKPLSVPKDDLQLPIMDDTLGSGISGFSLFRNINMPGTYPVVKSKSEDKQITGDILPVFVPRRRSQSQPQLFGIFDDTLLVPQDFNTALEEIHEQKVQIRQLKHRRRLQEVATVQPEEEEITMEQELSPQPVLKNILSTSQALKEALTPAEIALQAGRTYVILPKKLKSKKRGSVNMARIEAVEEFLKKPSRSLVRSDSMHEVERVIERELRVPERIRSHRLSVPNLFEFENYKKKRGMLPNEDEREWARDIWNGWFDEVYPPTPSSSEDEEIFDEVDSFHQRSSVTTVKEERSIKKKDSINSMFTDDIESLEPIPISEENAEILEILREEIDKLTKEMEETRQPVAFNLCRRGGLYRKVGELKKASTDLDKAIELEPLLLDAYWHRHLLYILQGKQQAALEDLNFIMKKNKQHAGAYRSMAEIYRKANDTTMAIINYTQAIKLNPQDHEAHFRRAQMYEERGEMLLALEDYSITTKIMPTRTDAIMKRGLYFFQNKNWNNAIHDFTDMLRVEPLSAVARLYRGQAYAKQLQWTPAVEDLSAAIHLDPDNWQAYFHRGSILRKSHPDRALLDLSMSLVINDSDDNIMSYLHRGILYDEMEQPEDAIPDFESVLKLNKDVACAHVNLGLIYMNKYDNYHRAIKRFGSAIKVEPTYVRAYVCRAEAYHKIHQLKLALRDFTRAIHLKPDVPHYYMYRGQLVLELGNMELAAFCVRHAAVLNQNTASSIRQRPSQEAVVQSFLKNYDKAIEALQNGIRSRPGGGLYMLLGKTQMKAKRFKDAVLSFENALIYLKPWKQQPKWPPELAEAHFLAGICNTELRRYLDAFENFNSAIKCDSVHAEAYYQRGLARMKLKQSKGILDFNRALAINPKLFQIYLSRACYYGLKGNYTKAILNCNEAIKIQPKSVRAYLYRGALKYHIKAYELAVCDLTKAAMINSTCALAYFNRAVCYQESKNYQKALQDYGIVLLIGEDLKLKVLINRGLLYFERKDYGNALYDFQMASKLSSEDHKIYHTLGLCFHKLDQLQKAVATFTHCIELKPFFLDGYICRGNVYMDYGHEQGLKYARRDYQRALCLDPVCLAARVNLAYTMQVAGKYMAAWQHFTCAITIKPTFKPALEGRAIVNLQMSDTFAAFQDIGSSIKVEPTAELLTNRGVINQFMNDRVNAMKDYQSAILLDPTYSLAYFNGANIYFFSRHFKQALLYYTKAIQHNPKDESAFLNRAITKVLLRDAQSALADFKMAIKLSPRSAHMYFNRGNLYSSMEQYEKAEKDYTKALHLQPDDALVLKRRADVRGKLGKQIDAIADYKYAIQIQTRPHKK